ncbi:MAG TPA: hypothetical protein VNJ08_04005 [Bacteriovoracaceae bacterium]|nr:hypothetical protein [Bacteriovoracaceae bacterium]
MKTLGLILALLFVMACKQSSTTGNLSSANDAGSFITAFNSGMTSVAPFEIVKLGNQKINYVVVKRKNSDGIVMYFALDIRSYIEGSGASSFMQKAPGYFNLTSNGNGTYSCLHCTSYTGLPLTTSLIFTKVVADKMELEKAFALGEAFAIETMSRNIVAEFGLTEERAFKVATLAKAWEKLSKSRALTNADADTFAKELVGVSIVDMEKAYKSLADGYQAEMTEVMEKAAEINGTTPENMTLIMTKLFF